MSEEGRDHPPTPPPSRPAPSGGGDGSSGFGERLARIEARMEHVATKEDIQRLRVWVLGGPGEGITVDMHEGIPGWLLQEHASFDLTGDPQTGRYRFHRAAHISDDHIFGDIRHGNPQRQDRTLRNSLGTR